MTFNKCNVIILEGGYIYMNNYLLYRKAKIMAISYNGLWKILNRKKLYKKDLVEGLNISSATMAKMGKGENVSLEVLQRICEYLECDIGDIMSFEKR